MIILHELEVMNMSILKAERINIKDKLNAHLSLRDSANQFFDELNQTNDVDNITIDFEGVESISRSFAQQFLYRVRNSDKEYTCINKPRKVEMMFKIVKNKGEKPVVVNSNESSIVNLSSALH
jgi:anti-anti-sigma regulatory factor